MSFPKNFVWGAATASYQIEGAAYEADKGLNLWDVASATPGRIFEGHKGDVGCDHYHHVKEDVALMKKIGLQAYRFSINWARLMPEGVGKVSEDGKRFYLELLQELKAAGIEPWITLYHWDYPYALYLKGGWLNSDSPKWFEEYASVCAELFQAYCDHYILINEPQCFIGCGYLSGAHAPFQKLPMGEGMIITHHVLMGCGLAEKCIRKLIPNAKIGMSQAYWPRIPKREEDYALAKKETFSCHEDIGSPSYFLDPVFFGRYPKEFNDYQKQCGFRYDEKDMDTIKGVHDFLGFNTYSGNYVTKENGKTVYVTPSPSTPKTDMRWNVHPDSMYYGVRYLYERYKKPVVCTENGVALAEWKDLDGHVNDDSRIDFIKRYLRAYHRAQEDGVELGGYFYWSLMDNFEWAEGFSKKFGLIHINYETGERTLKKSASFYKKVIKTNGEEILG